MHKGRDSVDIGIVLENFRGEMRGNFMRRRRRAVHRGDDSDVIPGADPAVRPAKPHERIPGRRGHRPQIGAKLIGLIDRAKFEVVHMHMRSRRNILMGKANDLRVFQHRLTGLDVNQRQLVTAWDDL